MKKYRFEITLNEGSDEMWEEAEDRGWNNSGSYKNFSVDNLSVIEDNGQIQMNF